MSVKANINLVHKWIEQVWNAGDLDSIRHFHLQQMGVQLQPGREDE